MAEKREFTFPSSDGSAQLRACEWVGDGEVRAIVQLVHGIAEHIDRYDDFAAYLADSGIAVFGHDLAGHGKSVAAEDDLGYFAEKDGWFSCVEDVHALRKIAQKEYPGKPYFIFGHSMGSFLTRTYITKYAGGLSGVVISGTGTNPEIALKIGRAVASSEMKKDPRIKSEKIRKLCFGSYNKRVKDPQNENEWLSRDTEVSKKYCEDPLCGFLPGASMYRNMFEGISYIQKTKNIAKVPQNLPMLFVSGTMDPVGSYGAGVTKAVEAYRKAGCSDISIRMYADGRHEMLNELNRDEVMLDVKNWIDSKI